jgi:uncharacterized protein YuzE
VRISYHPETDSLYIHLSDAPSVDSDEIANNFVIDFGEDGRVVGLDIDLASKAVDLSSVETNLPVEVEKNTRHHDSAPASHGRTARSKSQRRPTA